MNKLREHVNAWRGLQTRMHEALGLLELAQAENDEGVAAEIASESESIEQELHEREFELLFGGEYDKTGAVLSIHAGAGGTEAQDWAQMLLRMYLRYAEGRRWPTEVLTLNETDLLEPIPEVRLIREHLVINYRPVRFLKNNVELWLPESAQVYMSVRGRFFRREHTFSDYLLFSVDVNQKIAEPKEP